jgi:Transposase DDE domain
MKADSGQHFEQSFNAQAAVDGATIIVGERVSVAAISPVVKAEVKAILTDNGFYSEVAVQAVEQNPDGTASGMTVYAAVGKTMHHKTVEDLLPQAEPPPPAPDATPKQKMVKTQLGRQFYKLRQQTVESVFGIIKEVLGFRRFSLRGLEKVSLEWTLVCVSYNLKRPLRVQKPSSGRLKRDAHGRGAAQTAPPSRPKRHTGDSEFDPTRKHPAKSAKSRPAPIFPFR